VTAQFNLHGPDNTIVISHDRTFFGGPQVRSELVLGGYAIYVSVVRPIQLTIDGVDTEKEFLAIIPPHVRHSIKCGDGVRSILVEAESVSPDLMSDERFHAGGEDARAWAHRIEAGFQRWHAGASSAETLSLDLFFFGERLPALHLDERIVHAVERIRNEPDAPASRTGVIAKDVALSPSRLRHLFGEQISIPIRRFRAWKRLRRSIHIALREPNLLKLAMAAGYSDASHMCHSMRHYFGEQPSFVCATWRRANVRQSWTSERDSLVDRSWGRTLDFAGRE
jgi:AraC-like DNA-binding protein